MNIRNDITKDEVKKILANANNARSFLVEIGKITNIKLPYRTISKGANKGKTVLNLTANELYDKIVEIWDFKVCQKIIRDLFKKTTKYTNGKASFTVMETLVKEWEDMKLGKIAWPFSQGNFDGFVQNINASGISGSEKDEKVKEAALKYRRIKEINTVRNDFIETLIFEKNENIIPTLNHRRSVDFFINGISFDQKVAKSPTSQFKNKFGDNWQEEAKKNPEIVAEYLYKYQDEGRFGEDSRLLVVYIDEDVSIERIAKIINDTDLANPLKIKFDYNHKSTGMKSYIVECFVILLHKK